MSNYFRISEPDKLHKSIKTKPKWLLCLICMVTIIVMIASAISVGVFIGYAYCYVEHQTGLRPGNITHSEDHQILQNIQKDSPEAAYKRTINGALKSFLISKILKMSNFLWIDDGIKSTNVKIKS